MRDPIVMQLQVICVCFVRMVKVQLSAFAGFGLKPSVLRARRKETGSLRKWQ